MKTPQNLLPDLATLSSSPTTGLSTNGHSGRPVTVLKRALPRFMSTFPNEIVTCLMPDGRKRRIFMKYGAGFGHESFGHRGDIPYEANVYRMILQQLSDFRPKYLGAYADYKTGGTWLILEYVYNAVRVSDLQYHYSVRQTRARLESSRWIGRFHCQLEPRLDDASLSFLNRYDAGYYRGWSSRMAEYSQPLHREYPWLPALALSGDAWFEPLLSAPQTVIHGEYYMKTILARGKKLFMIDWESAAKAPGEIDLASLIEGKQWMKPLARRCEEEYKKARYPDGPPDDFDRILNAARMYLHFRWLGDKPEWATRTKSLWRYKHLEVTARRMDLI